MHTITNDKITTRKDKWGAQAIKRTYLCQWQSTQGYTQQWCTEEDLLHPYNILLEHNLLLITQYQNTKRTQKATKHTWTTSNTPKQKTQNIFTPLYKLPTSKHPCKNATRIRTSPLTDQPSKHKPWNPTYMTQMEIIWPPSPRIDNNGYGTNSPTTTPHN